MNDEAAELQGDSLGATAMDGLFDKDGSSDTESKQPQIPYDQWTVITSLEHDVSDQSKKPASQEGSIYEDSETRSHFSDSSSSDYEVQPMVQHEGDVVKTSSLIPPEESTVGDTKANDEPAHGDGIISQTIEDLFADFDQEISPGEGANEQEEGKEDEEQQWEKYRQNLYSSGPILPFAGVSDGEIYRRDAKFYRVDTRRRSGRAAHAKGLPSLLGDDALARRYKLQRDRYLRERNESLNKQDEQLAQLKEDEEWIKTMKHAIRERDENLEKADEYITKVKPELEETENELNHKANELSKQTQKLDALQKAYDKQRPFAVPAMQRKRLIDAGLGPRQYITPAFVCFVFCLRRIANMSHRVETQTEPMQVVAQPIRLPAEIRAQVATHVAEWANDTRQIDSGPVIDPLTAERVEALLDDGQMTFEQFVLALEQEGLKFQPDHLAQDLESFIRPFATVPSSLLNAARLFKDVDDAANKLLHEVSGLQQNMHELGTHCTSATEQQRALSGELAVCRKKLDEATTDRERLEAAHNELENEKANLLAMSQTFASESMRLEQETTQLETTITGLTEDSRKLADQNGQLSEDNTHLKHTNEGFYDRIEELSGRLDASETAGEKVFQQLTEKLDQFVSEADSKVAPDELKDLVSKLERHNEHGRQLAAQCEQLSKENEELRRGYEEVQTDLDAKIRQLEDELAASRADDEKAIDSVAGDRDRAIQVKSAIKEGMLATDRIDEDLVPATPAPVTRRYSLLTPKNLPSPPADDGLLKPSLLPSARGPPTPARPLSVLIQKESWRARERKIRNTEEWKKNRDAVLRHFQVENERRERELDEVWRRRSRLASVQ